MKYLVMDTKMTYCIIMDEMGAFHVAANLNYHLGDTIDDPLIMKKEVKKPWLKWTFASAWVVALATLLLLYFQTPVPLPVLYSRIYISINPEVCMSVDESGEVFALEGIDEEGKALIEGYDYKGKDELTVTGEIIDLAIAENYLASGMTITIEIDNEEALKEFGPALRQEANKRIEGRVDAVVEVGNYGSFDIAQETVTSPSPTPLPSAIPSPSPSPSVEYLPSPPPVSNNDSNYQDASSNYDDRQSNYDDNNSAYSGGSNYSNHD